MKKILSTKYSPTTFNVAILILRLGLGFLMLTHGYQKLTHYSETVQHMPSLLGMGSVVSAVLIIFAEFFCSLFIILGLFTRLSCIPLIIAMLVAIYVAHKGDIFGDGQLAVLYVLGYLVLALLGPGKISVDGMMK